MKQHDLSSGVIKACAGLVESCPNERVAAAIREAERQVGRDYMDTPEAQQNREYLVRMVKLNLVNRKVYTRESLNRKYSMNISKDTLTKEKKRFCYELAKNVDLI